MKENMNLLNLLDSSGLHSSGLLTMVADPFVLFLQKSFLLMEAVDFRKDSRLVDKVDDLREAKNAEDPLRRSWLLGSSRTESVVFKGLLDLAGGRGRRLRLLSLPKLDRKLAGAVRVGELSEDCLKHTRIQVSSGLL